MTKAKKMGLLVSIVLIVIGAIIFATKGFNYDLSYGAAKRIRVPMKSDFSIEDYKAISKEIYGDAEVETITVFKEGVSIKVKDTSDEQLDTLITKINEKYGYEYKREDIQVTEMPKVEFASIIKQAIIPIVITLLVVFVYMIIRYKKLGILYVVLNLLVPAIITQLLVLSIYLICRIPVTNVLLPILLTVYAGSIIYSTKQCEDKK